jgi:hypothetical protein
MVDIVTEAPVQVGNEGATSSISQKPIIESKPLDDILNRLQESSSEPRDTLTTLAVPSSTTDREIYDVSSLQSDIIEHYQPQYLGKGGEHFVYSAKDHPDSVIKVSTQTLKQIINYNRQHALPLDGIPEEARGYATEYLRIESDRLQKFRSHFGNEHVLNQRKYLMQVPVNETILKAIYKGSSTDTPQTQEAWAVVTIQQRADEISDPEHLSVTASYAEFSQDRDNPEYQEDYKHVTDTLLQPKEGSTPFNRVAFLKLHPHLEPIIADADNDPELKKVLAEIVTRSVSYSNTTGETLDLAGGDNLVIFKKDGKWNYRLLDAMYPNGGHDTTKMIEDSRLAFTKLAQGQEIDQRERNLLLNTVNYARAINGFAAYLGLDQHQFIHLIPKESYGQDFDLINLLKRENL